MIWNETIECMDREQLRELQSSRLKKMAEYVYYNTPFYRKKFQEMGLEPGDIKSIDDITKLPFTNKLDLRDNYPGIPHGNSLGHYQYIFLAADDAQHHSAFDRRQSVICDHCSAAVYLHTAGGARRSGIP